MTTSYAEDFAGAGEGRLTTTGAGRGGFGNEKLSSVWRIHPIGVCTTLLLYHQPMSEPPGEFATRLTNDSG